jgi:hypothetical protein
MGDFYLVDDIAFSKATKPPVLSPNTESGGRVEQWRWRDLVNTTWQPMIAVKIDPSIPVAWHTNIVTAVNDWNSIDQSRVNLYITNGSSVDITIRGENLDLGYYGYGEYPRGDGKTGTRVVLNLQDSPEYRRKTTIVHEIGHCLGFVHTDQGDPSFAIQVPGTTERDFKSIMNSGGAPNRQQSWEQNGGFSSYDWQSLQILYPEQTAGDRVFDLDFYKYGSPDVDSYYGGNSASIQEHWRSVGAFEGRVASPIFDVDYYRTAHPDFVAIGMTRAQARNHWLNTGMMEGRASSPVFDVQYYLANNPDLVTAYGNTGFLRAYHHWLYQGIDEGRIASPKFYM